MSFELPFENNPQETSAERREKLKEGFGVVLCTKQKEGGISTLEEQTSFAEEMDLPSVQFDFRDRTIDEILAAKEAILKYRELHPDVAISIHGETPKIDEASLDFKNKERTGKEIELLQEVLGESYTIHPPSINSKLFNELPDNTREKILQNYINTFALAVKNAFENGKRFSFGIENMPTKGDEGSLGQTVEDVLMLIKKLEQAIVDQGIDVEIAREYVGATLDINHALHGVEQKDYQNILESWFKGLGEYLKIVHLYTPSEAGKGFEEKYRISLNLASQFSPNARLFMESKQDPKITKDLYDLAKQID